MPRYTAALEEGPPRKLQKLDTGAKIAKGMQQYSSQSSPIDDASSFNFKNQILTSSPDDYILDITKFIPAGCLRVRRNSQSGITPSEWNTCCNWSAFPHPKDISSNRGGAYIGKELQTTFFNGPVLKPYLGLHLAGWIRLEFKPNDSYNGQVRVYILPDDIARAAVKRDQASLRKSLHALLTQLDISVLTWNGSWSDTSPYFHVDPSLDKDSKDEPSLFEIFNTLPSPKPNPEIASDVYVRDAMYKILDSDIPGLKTTMHNYQRRSAAMMLQRETRPGQIIDPRLTPQSDQKGVTWYCDVDAGRCFRDPRTFEAVRGGICAETMGLGKTLICLALILATRELSSQIPLEYSVGSIPVRKTTGSLMDMAAARLGRAGIPWKSDLAQFEASEAYTFERCREAIEKGAGHYFLPAPVPRRQSRHATEIPPRKIWLSATTIVVVPSNLVQQWRSEIKKHTVGLNVLYISSPSDKVPPARELNKYDILLFSRVRFEKEGSIDDEYRSPLRDFHFKRLIVDEGHSFGNSSNSSKTMAVTALESLQLSARWIISGTPTQGLYGAEVAIGGSSKTLKTKASSSSNQQRDDDPFVAKLDPDLCVPESDASSETSSQQNELFLKQERRDLEKLGNIATTFLQARPWANAPSDEDHASWSQLVMQPRHGSKSRGNMHSLRVTLEGMIIRHKPEDVLDDVTLPPLFRNVIYLDGSIQNKLFLNTFSLMIITNAVTSERKDADYFFHPRQRKNLQTLVSNLRQASFFWSGFEAEHVRNTIKNAKDFLEERKVPVTPEDEALLVQAIAVGEAVLASDIFQAICKWHEMPMYVQNSFPEGVRAAWSLNQSTSDPTLMGATMVHGIQKFIGSQLSNPYPAEGLLAAGIDAMSAALSAQEPAPTTRIKARIKAQKKIKDAKAAKKTSDLPPPALAGGVTVGDATSPTRKRYRAASITATKMRAVSKRESPGVPFPNDSFVLEPPIIPAMAKKTSTTPIDGPGGDSMFSGDRNNNISPYPPLLQTLQSTIDQTPSPSSVLTLDPGSQLAGTELISTASTKLSYLMDRIIIHQENEKILVFYEAENIAWYIAQALECLGVKHLIYAKTLSAARRSQYVVTFNQSDTFRVLLMDVSQAAFGLDMSSASRVYFVNPVFSPQVEAQAVKRAHRIGQTNPVYVETLVLKGSIEEVIINRREAMSNEEHNKCKSILDDQTMYDWIRNVRFQPTPSEEVPGPDQMAKLEHPQPVFGRGAGGKPIDPDADLLAAEEASPMSDKGKGIEPTPVKQSMVQNLSLEFKEFAPASPSPAPEWIAPKELRPKSPSPVYQPLDVPQEAESSASNQQPEKGYWEIPSWEDSDEELDI
ncbi:related to DNA repair protein rad8 [Phialocephala subalpina]|uniref:Related to DNA repair protein rad8 n=1 Tax=Phialocephala subalpina TaxID=576137 RepID=A0A1L7WBQ9_9HELO|nr:related to DNA repair protein rad8 [Phialocephala subalpina]